MRACFPILREPGLWEPPPGTETVEGATRSVPFATEYRT